MNNLTKKLVRIGAISGLYIVLSLIAFPIASGFIQFRPSEALCLLPLIFPETIISLFVGCALTNLITGCSVIDIIFGSLISLLSGLLTLFIGRLFKSKNLKYILGGIFPILLNAFFLPLIWYYCYGKLQYIYIIQVISILVSQSVSVYVLGIPTTKYIEKISTKL